MIWITCWKLFAIMKIHLIKITCIYKYTFINCVESMLVSHDHFPESMWLINWNWYTVFLYFSRGLSEEKIVPLIVSLIVSLIVPLIALLIAIHPFLPKNLTLEGYINILNIYSRTSYSSTSFSIANGKWTPNS